MSTFSCSFFKSDIIINKVPKNLWARNTYLSLSEVLNTNSSFKISRKSIKKSWKWKSRFPRTKAEPSYASPPKKPCRETSHPVRFKMRIVFFSEEHSDFFYSVVVDIHQLFTRRNELNWVYSKKPWLLWWLWVHSPPLLHFIFLKRLRKKKR